MAYLMIVDDDDEFANAAAEVLRDAGHEVRVELKTHDAVQSMAQRRPDLVILDVMFPESGSAGFELARTMRHEDEKLRGIPVLMLTAVNQTVPLPFSSRDIDDRWLPVTDFLEKPVDLDALENKVSALLLGGHSVAGGEDEGP
ncbi:MAG: response regulator transcription factor [Armatimonadota bacterium]